MEASARKIGNYYTYIHKHGDTLRFNGLIVFGKSLGRCVVSLCLPAKHTPCWDFPRYEPKKMGCEPNRNRG
jgi:hypothetical protein